MPDQTFPSKDLLLALVDQLQDAIFAIQKGRLMYANKQLLTLLSRPEDKVIDCPITDFIHEEDRDLVTKRYQARQHGEQVIDQYRFRIVDGGGKVKTVNMRVGILTHDDGAVTSIGSLLDVTEQINTMSALAKSQADIESILNNMPDVFYRTDMEGVITLISPSCKEAIGYAPDEMMGQRMAEFYWDETDRARVVSELKANNGKARQVEACMRHKDGTPLWVSTNAYIRYDDEGKPIGVEGIARDITIQKLREDQLAELGRVDDLTGLRNRRSFLESADEQLQIAKRYRRPLSVIMIDLDWFKLINDRHGHEAGDQALIYFADACRESFRKSDIIGRMGGEEFAILVPETDPQQALEMLNRLRQQMQSIPFYYNRQTIPFTLSAGLASLQMEVDTLNTLLSRSDTLLYKAKKGGRDQVVLESSSSDQKELS